MKKDGGVYVGADIGTTSIAAVVMDGRGKVLKTGTLANPSAGEPDEIGHHEQDADAIANSVNLLLGECEKFASTRKLEIVDIGWTGQMHGLVAVNRALQAITPFVTWRDIRCAPPKLGSGILEDWARRKVKGIHRVLTIPGYAIARRTGRCTVDATFRAAMGTEEQLRPFARWMPEMDDSQMLGDNQAGVYAALQTRPGATVINLGTSGQLSRVVETIDGLNVDRSNISVRPFPGGKYLLCRASHVGGAPLAQLRKRLRYSWERLNAEAETNGRIARCLAEIVDDLVKGVDLSGVRTVVGVGNAVRLNPCVRRAIERRLKVRCFVPEIKEMAAWGAALHVRDMKQLRPSRWK